MTVGAWNISGVLSMGNDEHRAPVRAGALPEVGGQRAAGSKDRKLVVPKAAHRKRAHAHPDHVTPTASVREMG
jgi:hypothetical protein